MPLRTDLQTLLEGTLGTDSVYFQPPTTVKMVYPCIVYARSNADTRFANNLPYLYIQRYQLTLIAKDPDSDVVGKIAMLPMCIFDRHYTADNLNHDVFNIFF